MKHATGRENCGNIKKDNPNSDIHLTGSKEIKKPSKKPFKLAGATKVEGEGKRAARKR